MDAIALCARVSETPSPPSAPRSPKTDRAVVAHGADEPILSFDGDNAAFAPPFGPSTSPWPGLSPERACASPSCRKGKTPTISCARATAADAVLAAARPLSEVLWMRETTAGPLDTPERKAALERRLREAVARIGDPLARRHYEADIVERLESFAPRRPSGRASSGRGAGGAPSAFAPRDGRRWGRFEPQRPPLAPSATLASQPAFSWCRSRCRPGGADRARARGAPGPLGRARRGPVEPRFHRPRCAGARPGAARRPCLRGRGRGWRCTVGRRARRLAREAAAQACTARETAASSIPRPSPRRSRSGCGRSLRFTTNRAPCSPSCVIAQRALGEDPSEANLAWLSDIHDGLPPCSRCRPRAKQGARGAAWSRRSPRRRSAERSR